MTRVVILDKRKAGMSFNDFKRYYEDIHAPLFLSLIPVNLTLYRRNYLQPLQGGDDIEGWGFDQVNYDCMVEMEFATTEDQLAVQQFLQSDAAKALAEDEENFLDRPSMVIFSAEPVASEV